MRRQKSLYVLKKVAIYSKIVITIYVEFLFFVVFPNAILNAFCFVIECKQINEVFSEKANSSFFYDSLEQKFIAYLISLSRTQDHYTAKVCKLLLRLSMFNQVPSCQSLKSRHIRHPSIYLGTQKQDSQCTSYNHGGIKFVFIPFISLFHRKLHNIF